MEKTQANDRARRFIASVCAFGFSLTIPLSLPLSYANASRWSEAASQEPANSAAAESAAPNSVATLATPAPTTIPSPAPTTTITDDVSDLPPTPGLRRLPPITEEIAPQSVTQTNTPVRLPPAEPIDWRRPSMVMGPLPEEAAPHQSQVRLISEISAIPPVPASQPTETLPLESTRELAVEIMPAHTTPENGAASVDTNPVDPGVAEVEPAPSTVVPSHYAQATAPVKEIAPKITPRYAANTASPPLTNPAETTLETPTEKPNFARVTDESMSSPAPQDGLSPIYVCRLLGLRSAKK